MRLEDNQVTRLIETLREYTTKLGVMQREIEDAEKRQDSVKSRRPDSYRDWLLGQHRYVMSLNFGLTELIRLASQTIEHSEISDIDRVALRVRMSDLEATRDRLISYIVAIS